MKRSDIKVGDEVAYTDVIGRTYTYAASRAIVVSTDLIKPGEMHRWGRLAGEPLTPSRWQEFTLPNGETIRRVVADATPAKARILIYQPGNGAVAWARPANIIGLWAQVEAERVAAEEARATYEANRQAERARVRQEQDAAYAELVAMVGEDAVPRDLDNPAVGNTWSGTDRVDPRALLALARAAFDAGAHARDGQPGST